MVAGSAYTPNGCNGCHKRDDRVQTRSGTRAWLGCGSSPKMVESSVERSVCCCYRVHLDALGQADFMRTNPREEDGRCPTTHRATNTPTASSTRNPHTCFSTPTTRSTGTHGAQKRSKRLPAKARLCFCPSAIRSPAGLRIAVYAESGVLYRPVTGVM